MTQKAMAFLGDIEALRRKVKRTGTPSAKLYEMIRNLAVSRPDSFPWYCAPVAIIDPAPANIENAKRQARNYVSNFQDRQLNMEIHFHFWCAAFPHARWCLTFKWIDECFGWDEPERAELIEKLIRFQYRNFFYGLRTKVEECLDNQTLALAFSNVLSGYLFEDEPAVGSIARRMKTEGLKWLPRLLERTPESGYSGEGSTYMDHVQGIGNTLSMELMRIAAGVDYFDTCRPALEIIRRLWMPCGLLLPFDHYGYCRPSRNAVAYLAARTGSPYAHELLNRASAFTHDIKTGWGMDDLVWTMIWQPDHQPGSGFESWAHRDLGGVLTDQKNELYLFQMWDSSEKLPFREHVNPNNLVLTAWDSPITIDGTGKDCERFHFKGASIVRSGIDFNLKPTWFGEGCGGGHGILLVDGNEAMHPVDKVSGQLVKFDPDRKIVAGDVTEYYRECGYPDAKRIRRSSALIDNTFWVIADEAEFQNEHDLTTRWLLRPEQIPCRKGIAIRTPEHVNFYLIPLIGNPELKVETVSGFPAALEGRTILADFTEHTKSMRQLYAAFPVRTIRKAEDLTDGWQVTTSDGLKTVSVNMPPDLANGLQPDGAIWTFTKQITVPDDGKTYFLRLPAGLNESAVCLNGNRTEITSNAASLLPAILPLHPGSCTVKLEVPDRVKPTGDNLFRLCGDAALLEEMPCSEPECSFENDILTVKWNGMVRTINVKELF